MAIASTKTYMTNFSFKIICLHLKNAIKFVQQRAIKRGWMGENFHGPMATKSDKLDMIDTPYNVIVDINIFAKNFANLMIQKNR